MGTNYLNNMDARFIFIMLIVIAIIFEVIGDIILKNWADYNNPRHLVAGLVVYSTGTLIWAFSLRYGYLSMAVSNYVILNMIIMVLVGIYIYDEHLNFINKIGIGLGVLSLILLGVR